ncbi:hypothetical protein CUJ83_05625 [Methanocella sp. CWC-04]|uniref:Uncharacterized protein n=1 Tax=Methanooceanicella nereidis TaxID=2052831 RepID=A0AAP2W6P4_9EURY|nr:hypothetical protein [Methanocella sp. CWC-04]MCD1294479.1 hypothetical protein [Methanocella sp. CWC-04]
MNLESSEIKQRIKEMITDGISDEYFKILRELKGSYRPDDIAAAAIALYAEQGGKKDVRRRTLKVTEFVPLKSKEHLLRSVKKKEAEQKPSIRPKMQKELVKAPHKKVAPGTQHPSKTSPQGKNISPKRHSGKGGKPQGRA